MEYLLPLVVFGLVCIAVGVGLALALQVRHITRRSEMHDVEGLDQ